MTKPYISTAPIYSSLIKMSLAVAATASVIYRLKTDLVAIFYGNPELNGFIIGAFVIGVWSSFTSVRKIAQAAEWVNKDEIAPDEIPSLKTFVELYRALPQYIANTLVFLGLLGTFWGLMTTIGGISIIAVGADGLPDAMEGMATALSTSLFGLGGSLILGFLQLQAGIARKYFNETVGNFNG